MALTLSLFQRPGAVLFLDDDPDYLEMLGMVVPGQTQVELYSRPSGFLARMQAEPAHWETDAALQVQMIDRWRQGQALIPQVLHYWASRPERYRLAKICVVDYAMPGTAHWLQLEPTASLGDLAELAASAALGMDVVQAVRDGRRLAAVELHQQLALRGPVRTAPANPIGEDGLLMAASFPIAANELPQPIYAYQHFLQAENHRTVQDH